jgi:oligopeptide/dipeptide ABC transporter ATP-binding protein
MASVPVPDRQALLEVRGLTVSFPGAGERVKAVDGVSLDVRESEIVGLVGESGCGKSATALAIMGLIEHPGLAEADAIEFRGRDLTRMSPSQMRRIRGTDLAMIFQEPMTSLNPVLSIGEQVAEVLRAHRRVGRAEARAHAVQLLGEVGIPDPRERASQYPHEISGGMRQRVMIAGALACEPGLLIADEPTTALDVTVQAQILDLIGDIRDEHRTAVLLITHDLGVVATTCDRVAVMYAGRLVEAAPSEELFATPLHPYTRGLLESIPTLGEGVRGGLRLRPIAGTVPAPGEWPPGCKFEPRCSLAIPSCSTSEPELVTAGGEHRVRCPVVLGRET